MAQEGKSSVSLLPGGIAPGDLKLKPQIQLFRSLIETHWGDHVRLNEMTGKPEWFDAFRRVWQEWDDVQESQMRAFLQAQYGLYHRNMLEDALSIHFEAHRVNPLTDLLDSLRWDGKPRVRQFLTDVLKCEDSDYIRECSRLIFAGGIHRAFRPGCKFDDMIVLVGGQGAGKSTIVRWLNIEDEFFREIKTISGKEGIEAIRGVWIGEVSELMAMTRVKEAEAVKAYITSQVDSYRPPYQKHVLTIPRRCVFIGTTNNPQFLTDKSGNRRFYPVRCKSNGYSLLDHEEEIRDYIRQAWAEAVHLFREGDLQPFARKEALSAIRDAQEQAMEDDWRIGAIGQYLEDMKKLPNSMVSVIELWHNALKEPEESKPTRKDSIEITQIITNTPGWCSAGKQVRTKWGQQKAFIKANPFFPAWK